jgi:hypothetical protein
MWDDPGRAWAIPKRNPAFVFEGDLAQRLGARHLTVDTPAAGVLAAIEHPNLTGLLDGGQP